MSDRAVLFDLDGTLSASAPGILASARHALSVLGEPIPSEAQLLRFIGPPLVDSFREVCGLDPVLAQRAVAAYRAYYAEHGQFDTRVYDGMPEVLAALREQDRTVAVATSKAQVFAESVLDHLGLAPLVDLVVGAELDGRRTRKAEVVAQVLAQLPGPAAAGAVMVGDRHHDVEGAAAHGLPCIGAVWGYGGRDELLAAGAVALAERPEDLPALLGLGAGSPQPRS